MKRLVRTLTVVLGVLIALAGGGVVLLRARAGDGPRTAASVRASASSEGQPGTGTTSPDPGLGLGAVPGDAGAGTSASSSSVAGATSSTAPASRGTTPTSRAPVSPFAALTAALAGTNACLTVEDGSGRALYLYQPDTPLIPASTQKLLVAEAALATLGPNYRFTTKVVAPAAPLHGQVAQLWLVGGGDPLLATPEFIASTAGRARVAGYPWTPLAGLADSLAAAGITEVPGGIRGDDSYEDRLRFLPVWPALYQQQKQIGLLSALSVNEGIQYTPASSTLAQDPPNYAASELARLLQLGNVPVSTQADQAAPTAGVVVASVTSAPLSQIVQAMIRASDNWIAELLVRAIDKAGGGTGTTAGGVAIVLHNAAQTGIPLAGVHMDDGSGLSRTDRATCRELQAALDLGNRAQYKAVLDGLAVAGQTGTLATRYRGTPIAGKLRAKTGSLDNVGGMVGMVTVGAPLRFAFLDNDTQSDSAVVAKEDAIVGALAAYTGGA